MAVTNARIKLKLRRTKRFIYIEDNFSGLRNGNMPGSKIFHECLGGIFFTDGYKITTISYIVWPQTYSETGRFQGPPSGVSLKRIVAAHAQGGNITAGIKSFRNGINKSQRDFRGNLIQIRRKGALKG